jgi:hypothetical protein
VRALIITGLMLGQGLAMLACGGNGGPAVDAAPVGPGQDVCVAASGRVVVYVDGVAGSDGNRGTSDAPLASIEAGIGRAGAQAASASVFVAAGVYEASLALESGVSICGGFDPATGWTRDPAVHVTEIRGAASAAVSARAIERATWLDGLTIASVDATAPGQSSIAILAVGSSGLRLRGVVLRPGNGAPGADGATGATGADGEPGATGDAGCEDDIFPCGSCSQPDVGSGGASTCNVPGGDGGASGFENADGTGGTLGTAPSASDPEIGASGGTAGTGDQRAGGAGDPGGPGTDGSPGAGGGEIGTFQPDGRQDDAGYEPASGEDGTAGTSGGSGGGGGGGHGGSSFCNSFGGAGGGGGAGGCGGGAGQGGGGGGGSFGLLLIESTAWIADTDIQTGNGGGGGAGGAAGPGGAGGDGGGASAGEDDAGGGGAGGAGGAGGRGGAGGGGGGGPAIGVVCSGDSTIEVIGEQTGLQIQIGSGGAAGASDGNPGAPGLAVPALGCGNV